MDRFRTRHGRNTTGRGGRTATSSSTPRGTSSRRSMSRAMRTVVSSFSASIEAATASGESSSFSSSSLSTPPLTRLDAMRCHRFRSSSVDRSTFGSTSRKLSSAARRRTRIDSEPVTRASTARRILPYAARLSGASMGIAVSRTTASGRGPRVKGRCPTPRPHGSPSSKPEEPIPRLLRPQARPHPSPAISEQPELRACAPALSRAARPEPPS